MTRLAGFKKWGQHGTCASGQYFVTTRFMRRFGRDGQSWLQITETAMKGLGRFDSNYLTGLMDFFESQLKFQTSDDIGRRMDLDSGLILCQRFGFLHLF
jgi:hypothetical protein